MCIRIYICNFKKQQTTKKKKKKQEPKKAKETKEEKIKSRENRFKDINLRISKDVLSVKITGRRLRTSK